jgi:hypothetical protein
MTSQEAFEKWANHTFGTEFKVDETLTYFRMDAAFEAGWQAAIQSIKDGGAEAYKHYYEDFSQRIAKAPDSVAQASTLLYKLPEKKP